MGGIRKEAVKTASHFLLLTEDRVRSLMACLQAGLGISLSLASAGTSVGQAPDTPYAPSPFAVTWLLEYNPP